MEEEPDLENDDEDNGKSDAESQDEKTRSVCKRRGRKKLEERTKVALAQIRTKR